MSVPASRVLATERVVGAASSGAKLRNYIIHEFRDVLMIRADAINALRQKRVWVNGLHVLDSHRLASGDCVRVEIDVLEAVKSRLSSLDVELQYSEPGLAVLLKAPGISRPDVEWAVPAMLILTVDTSEDSSARIADGHVVPWVAVNEVEKGVRGLVIVADSEERRDIVARNIANGHVCFDIYALCHGSVGQNIAGGFSCATIALTDQFDKWCAYNHVPVDIFSHVGISVGSVIKSSSVGYISTIRASVSHTANPSLVLRRFMHEHGFPVAGSQNYARQLPNHKDKGVLLAHVGVRMPSLAYSDQQVCVVCDVPPKLQAVCEREQRFYEKRQHKAQAEIARLTLVTNSGGQNEDFSVLPASVALVNGVELIGDKPVAYVTGVKQFCGHLFRATTDTLIPRQSTETLVRVAIEILQGAQTRGTASVLDLGTGTGCILLSLLLAMPGACGIGVDISEPAVAVAKDNCRRHGLEERATILLGSFDGFANDASILANAPFDIILCNPPYISPTKITHMLNTVGHEPMLALVAEDGGYQAYRVIHASLADNLDALAPGGCVAFEIGKDMEKGVRRIFSDWTEVGTFKDDWGFLRVIVFQRP